LIFLKTSKKCHHFILFIIDLGRLAAARSGLAATATRRAADTRLAAATGSGLAAALRLALRLAATRFPAMTVASRFAFDGVFELLVTRGAFCTVVGVSETQHGHLSAALALGTASRLGLARGTALASSLALAHAERTRLLTTGMFEASVLAAATRNILLQIVLQTGGHSGVSFEVGLETANTRASGTRTRFSRRFTFSHVFI